MAHRARSAFEVDGLRKEMGGGRKEGCLQRKWEQWPLSALFHPLPPSLSHIERAQKVFGYINTPPQNVRTAEFLLLLSTYVESFFPKLNSPWKITTRDKNKPLPFKGDPLRVLMTGTGLCNKSKFAAIPRRRGMWCAKGGPGLRCLQEPGSELWSSQCVSTANHFQMGLWRFMSWVIAIPTHVQAWGPKEGEAELRAKRKIPNSPGIWVWVCLINLVPWRSVHEIGRWIIV